MIESEQQETGADSGQNLRSRRWFDDQDDPITSALYVERYMNWGLTREELQSGRPIIGIAQTGSDLVPCNRHHVALAARLRDGIRDAGGIPLEFPVHPLQETGKRPTAALDRNLAYLGLVEVLFGYPLDGVILTTGCDKTTPACLMAAATVNIPAIVFSGGPMLNGWSGGQRAGSGTATWRARELHASGDMSASEAVDFIASASPSPGHCNTMGTALTMNSLAEAIGMSLPGCAAIPAAHRERGEMGYRSARRIVEMVREDLKPSDIMTRKAFENAITLVSAIGGSTNAPIHLAAIARHMGVELELTDWQDIGQDLPLLVDLQPAGRFLAEDFFQAGGVPAVMHELIRNKRIHEDQLTVNGRTVGENYGASPSQWPDVIRPWDAAVKERAGFLVLSGNLFDNAIMKTSVISDDFRRRYLSDPGDPNCFIATAVVFDGPEEYHARIDDPALHIDENSILVIRGTGALGYPGSAEVVNMQPPAAAIAAGLRELPCLGDGRQSGTSGSPSILNASPEAAAGGGLALLESGDRIRVDLATGHVDALVPDEEWAARRERLDAQGGYVFPASQTPWQELQRMFVGQLGDGMTITTAEKFQRIAQQWEAPRHSH